MSEPNNQLSFGNAADVVRGALLPSFARFRRTHLTFAQTYAPLFQLIWYGVWRKLFGRPREEASDFLSYDIFFWSSNHLGHVGYLLC